MSFFDFFKMPDINEGVEQYKNTPNAILLDVRTAGEYADGYIEGSINIPLDNLRSIENVITDKSTPIFVHCLSGSRSASAAKGLGMIGYTNVTNIGGIAGYRGKICRG
ncbi:MAG: rhodanese-like domain-containing protein [Lachnospiraceae bacterium]|nr:rhodanese-like domain-containing protein [Lachnospiraceae bacterium]